MASVTAMAAKVFTKCTKTTALSYTPPMVEEEEEAIAVQSPVEEETKAAQVSPPHSE